MSIFVKRRSSGGTALSQANKGASGASYQAVKLA